MSTASAALPGIGVHGSGYTTPTFITYVSSPSGWQPWNINSTYAVTSWSQETIDGVMALVGNCLSVNDQGTTLWTKVWIPLASVDATG